MIKRSHLTLLKMKLEEVKQVIKYKEIKSKHLKQIFNKTVDYQKRNNIDN